MHSPDHHSCESGCTRFQCGQIADATLIESATVVDDEKVSVLRIRHRLEKNINAPEMSGGKYTATANS